MNTFCSPAKAGRALLAATLLAGLWLGGTGTAAADPEIPWSGDERATPAAGSATTCAAAGLAGERVEPVHQVSAQRYVDITGVAEGITLTGVVVAGGPGYNTYLPSGLSALPWQRLHAPLLSAKPGAKPALLEHWFACGTRVQVTTTTRPTTTSTAPTTTSAPGTTTTTAGPTTTATTATPTPSVTATPSTTPVPPAPGGDDGSQKLASTGFDGGWLIALAAILLLGGAALVIVPKVLAARRRRQD